MDSHDTCMNTLSILYIYIYLTLFLIIIPPITFIKHNISEGEGGVDGVAVNVGYVDQNCTFEKKSD